MAFTDDGGVPESVEALLIGASAPMREVRRLVRQVAVTTAPVLVTGPSGSGKELVARAIHAESARAQGPFVAINCGAIPRDLLESQLFGHERGAFTGAIAQTPGKFEDADGGTLFLDEIGDMPLDMQVKLLRVLEEDRITRVGGRTGVPVDTRTVSATHRDIDAAIDGGSFREDLFYRLSVFPIRLPSLAERREDVPLLVAHFLRLKPEHERRIAFDEGAMQLLMNHDWPGNVRELRNVVDRAAILFAGITVDAARLEQALIRRPGRRAGDRGEGRVATFEGGPIDLKAVVARFERDHIAAALGRTHGNVTETARLLGMQRTTLIDKMAKHRLEGAGARPPSRPDPRGSADGVPGGRDLRDHGAGGVQRLRTAGPVRFGE